MFEVLIVKLAFFLLFFINLCFGTEQPLFIKADEAKWHQTTKDLIITGNVLVIQTNNKNEIRKLRCNELRYNSLRDKITANGKVELTESDGTIITSETLELDSHFDTGFLTGMRLFTNDASRLSANSAKREHGNTTTFEKAEYSPCKLCSDGSVTWKLDADTVEHDAQEQLIKYRNVFLTFKGIKVFYMPYFSHPDPAVKHKNGFLSPVPGVSSNLGAHVSMPYVFTTGTQDLTVTPMIMTKQNPLLSAEYRRRFINGALSLGGSYTHSKDDKVKLYNHIPRKNRWNVSSYLECHITDRNRLLVDLNRASDTTYLTRYRLNKQHSAFDRKKNLTSTVHFENFGDQSYFSSKGQSFQTDTPKTTPLVLPYIQYKLHPESFANGSYLEWDSSLLAIMRRNPILAQTGKQTYRASSKILWSMPYVTSNGHILKSTLSTRGDAYICQRYVSSPGEKINKNDNKVATRLFSQGSLDWRYPLLAKQNALNWILEPRGLLAVAPQKINRRRLPNEDSRFFTLDDTSLFLPNRFDGIDRIDDGKRIAYGADNHLNFGNKQKASMFFGQSYRLDNKSVAGFKQGESRRGSDYITRALYSPREWFVIFARSAFLQKTLKSRYSEIGSCIGKPKLQLDVAYTHAKRGLNASETMVSQLSWQLSSKLQDNCSLSFSQIRNLKRFKKGILATFAGIKYEDDCFKSSLNLYRSHYSDRDIKPDTGFMLQFNLKNLGTFTPVSTATYPRSILTRFKR